MLFSHYRQTRQGGTASQKFVLCLSSVVETHCLLFPFSVQHSVALLFFCSNLVFRFSLLLMYLLFYSLLCLMFITFVFPFFCSYNLPTMFHNPCVYLQILHTYSVICNERSTAVCPGGPPWRNGWTLLVDAGQPPPSRTKDLVVRPNASASQTSEDWTPAMA